MNYEINFLCHWDNYYFLRTETGKQSYPDGDFRGDDGCLPNLVKK